MRTNRIRKTTTVLRKLFSYFLIIIISMFFMNIYSMYGFKSFYKNFYDMLNELVEYYSISPYVGELYEEVVNYANSGNKDYMNSYNSKYLSLKNRIKSYKESSDSEMYYYFKDIESFLLSFNEKSIDVVESYDNKSARIYINRDIVELEKIKGYIQQESMSLVFDKLEEVQKYYIGFKRSLAKDEGIIYLLTMAITIICLLFSYRFSKHISNPIHQLVLRLKRVGKGDFDVDEVAKHSNDEINVLIDSFNNMIVKLRKLIEEIKQKAKVESKLKEQEIKNLEMSNLLKQSELDLLQSQINPHFLFNTLNSIAGLADIEEAQQTKLMLENMADILRYNLKKLNEKVTLKEEYEVTRSYLYIQSVRFGNRIQYELDIDEKAMQYKVPSMILQPFVENAIIHGLEPMEGVGVLKLSIKDLEYGVKIIIQDDGIGMTEEKRESLTFDFDPEGLDKSTNGGIGVRNVLRRLQLTYKKNVVEIKSELGKGTQVEIMLPGDSPLAN